MNENAPPDLRPMSPRLARVLPLAGTAILAIVAFAVGLAYGHGPHYAAVAALICAGSMLGGWGVLLLFGRPVQGDEWFWVVPMGFIVSLLTPRVTPLSYASILIRSLLMAGTMGLIIGTVGRAISRRTRRFVASMYRPRGAGGTSGGDREAAAGQGDAQP
ncbi:hypothetical protein [Paludisphaera sp.]|uniref:hypothetical protein n=1 Tax=Paludisphaera sp. TaxID=2017432 RepID=UPI00301B9829